MTLIFCCTTVFSGIDEDVEQSTANLNAQTPVHNLTIEEYIKESLNRAIGINDVHGLEEAKASFLSDITKNQEAKHQGCNFLILLKRCSNTKEFIDTVNRFPGILFRK